MTLINNTGIQPDFCSIPKELVFNSVYSFVSKLPYSMDPMNKNFISAELYNYTPIEQTLFENPSSDLEYISLFLELQAWKDTRRTSYAIQLCYIFQLMLSGKMNPNYEINEEDFKVWGVEESYKNIICTILKKFPEYYEKINNCSNQEKRDIYLNELYEEIKVSFSRFKPKSDLEMFYYFQNITYKDISRDVMERPKTKKYIKNV